MLVLTAHFNIKPEHVADFREVISRQGNNAMEKEEGCFQFDISQHPEDEIQFFLYEVYRDQAAIDAHQKTPHFADYRKSAEPWVISRDVTIWNRLQP